MTENPVHQDPLDHRDDVDCRVCLVFPDLRATEDSPVLTEPKEKLEGRA